jgi:hypothetical protein
MDGPCTASQWYHSPAYELMMGKKDYCRKRSLCAEDFPITEVSASLSLVTYAPMGRRMSLLTVSDGPQSMWETNVGYTQSWISEYKEESHGDQFTILD